MRVFTGPDGPYRPEFTWPDGICGKKVGTFIVKSGYGREVPAPEPLLCTRGAGHDPGEGCFTELAWME